MVPQFDIYDNLHADFVNSLPMLTFRFVISAGGGTWQHYKGDGGTNTSSWKCW